MINTKTQNAALPETALSAKAVAIPACPVAPSPQASCTMQDPQLLYRILLARAHAAACSPLKSKRESYVQPPLHLHCLAQPQQYLVNAAGNNSAYFFPVPLAANWPPASVTGILPPSPFISWATNVASHRKHF